MSRGKLPSSWNAPGSASRSTPTTWLAPSCAFRVRYLAPPGPTPQQAEMPGKALGQVFVDGHEQVQIVPGNAPAIAQLGTPRADGALHVRQNGPGAVQPGRQALAVLILGDPPEPAGIGEG